MSTERIYHCDGPGDFEDRCGVRAQTALAPPYLPMGFIETREICGLRTYTNHFCSWDCAMRFAAKQPVAEVVDPREAGR